MVATVQAYNHNTPCSAMYDLYGSPCSTSVDRRSGRRLYLPLYSATIYTVHSNSITFIVDRDSVLQVGSVFGFRYPPSLKPSWRIVIVR